MLTVNSKSDFAKLWNAVERKWAALKAKRPDRREYTLMFVPHHGRNVVSLRIPIRLLKYSAVALCVMLVLTIGTFVSYRTALSVANTEKIELEQLRQTNAVQNNQLDQLSKATAALQEDMTRLNKLDADLRRMVNTEDLPGTSRSGVARPGSGYNGQGGPVVKPQAGELLNLVQELRATAQARENSLTALRETLVERNARLSATPSIWPAGGEVTSRFGWRTAPYGWGSDWHPGLDIANDYGTPIVATADGEVVFSGWYGGYGNMVQINHGYGVVTVYGHCAQNLVNVGDQVKKGGVIAYMGSTGYSTGTHVHYEIRVNGTAVNPVNFL
ncbi:MAG: M23 family metallopeptidase [Negativicutes bacterium]|nr:M23 family metallopeptidase [Negativicutes bacterium]